MKKKAVSVVLAAAMAVSMLAGCGSDKQETQQESTSAATTESMDSSEAGTQENQVNGIDISEPYEATMVLIGNQQADQDGQHETANPHISPNYCSRLFKKETGKTLSQYLVDKRIEKAKALLCSEISVKNVSLQVGYSNFSYFSKLFKEETGITPMEYRERGKQ